MTPLFPNKTSWQITIANVIEIDGEVCYSQIVIENFLVPIFPSAQTNRPSTQNAVLAM